MMVRPSALNRIVQCPGSVRAIAEAIAPLPEDDNDAANEGTVAHMVAAGMLDEAQGVLEVGQTVDFESGSVTVTQDMYDYCREYYMHVMKACQAIGGLRLLRVEQTLNTERILGAGTSGTPDAYLYSPEHTVLHVWDFKYGYKWHDPYRHYQLVAYAGSVLLEAMAPPETLVYLHIVQPRAWHPDGRIRTWGTTGGALRAEANYLAARVQEAYAENAPRHTGPACKYCPVRLECPSMHAAVAGACDLQYSSAPAPVDSASFGHYLATLDDALEILQAQRDGAEAQALAMLAEGKRVQGYESAVGYGRRKWSVPDAQIIALGQMYGRDVTETKPKSPAQVEKLGIPKEVVKQYTITPTTGAKLKRITTPRAERIFSND